MEAGRSVRRALHKWSKQEMMAAWIRAVAVDMTKVEGLEIKFEGEIY